MNCKKDWNKFLTYYEFRTYGDRKGIYGERQPTDIACSKFLDELDSYCFENKKTKLEGYLYYQELLIQNNLHINLKGGFFHLKLVRVLKDYIFKFQLKELSKKQENQAFPVPITGNAFKILVYDIYVESLKEGKKLDRNNVLYKLEGNVLIRSIDWKNKSIEWGSIVENPVSFDRLQKILTEVKNYIKAHD